jgi:flagellar M-ring protein FliF
MKNFTSSLLATWQQLGVNQRVSLFVAALAVVGGLIAIMLWSKRPDYQLLYARMGDKDAAAVISYLQAQNIPHNVTAGGTAVQVPVDQVYKLRMDLAGKGIPSGEGVGFEIFDKGQFGLSDFVQRTNYIRALQGELGRTIVQVQGIRSARVMIVQPENRLLLTEQGIKPTASVFVDVGGGRLEPDQVNSIRHLVANSVQGLGVDHVAVIDNRGRVLSEELKQDPMLGTASSQMRHKQQVEDYLSRKVETMLATVIGSGNAVVRVSADIETESTTLTAEKFDPEGQVIRTQTITEDTTSSSEASSQGGAVGVSANVPEKVGSAAETAKPISTNDQSRKNRTTNYEINRTTTATTRSPGAVRSLSAAVIIAPRMAPPPPAPGAAADAPVGAPVAQKRSPEELAALRQIVINALGVKPIAGQSLDSLVTLQETLFQTSDLIPAQIAAIQSEGRIQGWLEAGSRWAAVVGAVIVLLIFLRMLAKEKPQAVPAEVLALSPDSASRAIPNTGGVTPELLNELIRAKPANVGVALRDWVSAGTTNAPAGKS